MRSTPHMQLITNDMRDGEQREIGGGKERSDEEEKNHVTLLSIHQPQKVDDLLLLNLDSV